MREQVVYVRSTFSRVHVAVMRDGVPYTGESCDMADVDPASREVIYSLAEVDSTELCGSGCFPRVSVQGEEETVTS